MPPTDEQQAVIDHDVERHGRVLAGPGTGKSYTAVALMERLASERPDLRTRMVTFTRAATAEFARKMGDSELAALGGSPPSTVHAFALSLLMREAGAGLPSPLRIPDSWEAKNLVRPGLSRGLKAQGYDDATPTLVEKLEREMAAAWQALDGSIVLVTDIDPQLRTAYVAAWSRHRTVFGYALLAELPYRAGQLIEDVGLPDGQANVLLVDEYQDLNEADIKLIRAVANEGVTILAIGDDDQSIYGFRMAAPAGIRRFLDEFETDCDYPLSESRRCGGGILDAANTLIASEPGRPPKTPLRPGPDAAGTFRYLRFDGQEEEADGVARMIEARLAQGVEPNEIAVLVRSSRDRWVDLLEPALDARGIALASTASVEAALDDEELRRGIALAHLATRRDDSLSWWTLLELTDRVGPTFIDYIVNEAAEDETFGSALLRLYEGQFPGASHGRSQAASTVDSTLAVLQRLDLERVAPDERGWGGWLLDQLDQESLSEEAVELLLAVGPEVPWKEGLPGFLSQLEPLGKDLAANEGDSVRLMTMTQAKGLTVDTVFVMGVEEGLIPFPRGSRDEERRLLYVAITRATDLSVLTWAKRRTGPIARQGSPTLRNRRRSSLLADLPVGAWSEGERFVQELRQGS